MKEVEYYDPPKNQMQQLLEELIDRGVIYEWYYNGEYHWSYTKDKYKEEETEERICETCKHLGIPSGQEPCKSCYEGDGDNNNKNWESTSEVKKKSCKGCLHLEMARDGSMYCKQEECVKDKPKLTEVKPVTAEDLKEDKDISHKMRDVVQSIKHWRPFKDCEELIEFVSKRDYPNIQIDWSVKKPFIWVKSKEYGTENLITAFDNTCSVGATVCPCVFIQDIWIDLQQLYDNFEFLDSSPCGCEEE